MNKRTVSLLSAFAGTIIGAAAGAGAVAKKSGKAEMKMKEYSDKHLALFLLMNQWVRVKQEGKSLSDYFEKNGYKKIAVYGMSYVGETMVNELKDTKIEVVYGIDKNADTLYSDVDIVSYDDALQPVDAVVVTAISYFDEIEELLSKKMDCPILSIEDIVYEL